MLQVPKQVTKKVCKSTKSNDEIHGGYSEHSLAKEIAPPGVQFDLNKPTTQPTAAAKTNDVIQTYDFDGIEEVEFSEFHSPSSPLLPDYYARQLRTVGDDGAGGFESKRS